MSVGGVVSVRLRVCVSANGSLLEGDGTDGRVVCFFLHYSHLERKRFCLQTTTNDSVRRWKISGDGSGLVT